MPSEERRSGALRGRRLVHRSPQAAWNPPPLRGPPHGWQNPHVTSPTARLTRCHSKPSRRPPPAILRRPPHAQARHIGSRPGSSKLAAATGGLAPSSPGADRGAPREPTGSARCPPTIRGQATVRARTRSAGATREPPRSSLAVLAELAAPRVGDVPVPRDGRPSAEPDPPIETRMASLRTVLAPQPVRISTRPAPQRARSSVVRRGFPGPPNPSGHLEGRLTLARSGPRSARAFAPAVRTLAPNPV